MTMLLLSLGMLCLKVYIREENVVPEVHTELSNTPEEQKRDV